MIDPVAPTPAEVELQRSRELLAKVWGDPNLRPGVRKYIKDLFPDRHLPDDDFDAIAAPLRAENADLKKGIDELKDMLKKRDEVAEKERVERTDALYANRLEDARRKFALTDEGYAQMKARMIETGNHTDPMAAAAYIVSQTPPVLPSGPLYGTNALDFAKTEGSDLERYKLLHQGLDGPAKYLEAEIRDCFGPNGKDYVAREMGRAYADLAFAN